MQVASAPFLSTLLKRRPLIQPEQLHNDAPLLLVSHLWTLMSSRPCWAVIEQVWRQRVDTAVTDGQTGEEHRGQLTAAALLLSQVG